MSIDNHDYNVIAGEIAWKKKNGTLYLTANKPNWIPFYNNKDEIIRELKEQLRTKKTPVNSQVVTSETTNTNANSSIFSVLNPFSYFGGKKTRKLMKIKKRKTSKARI